MFKGYIPNEFANGDTVTLLLLVHLDSSGAPDPDKMSRKIYTRTVAFLFHFKY